MLATEAQRALFHIERCIRLCDFPGFTTEHLQTAKTSLQAFIHAYRKYMVTQESDPDSYPFLSQQASLESLWNEDPTKLCALNSDPVLILPTEAMDPDDFVADGEAVHQNSLYGNPVDLMITKCLPGEGKQLVNEDVVNSLRDDFNEFTLNSPVYEEGESLVKSGSSSKRKIGDHYISATSSQDMGLNDSQPRLHRKRLHHEQQVVPEERQDSPSQTQLQALLKQKQQKQQEQKPKSQPQQKPARSAPSYEWSFKLSADTPTKPNTEHKFLSPNSEAPSNAFSPRTTLINTNDNNYNDTTITHTPNPQPTTVFTQLDITNINNTSSMPPTMPMSPTRFVPLNNPDSANFQNFHNSLRDTQDVVKGHDSSVVPTNSDDYSNYTITNANRLNINTTVFSNRATIVNASPTNPSPQNTQVTPQNFGTTSINWNNNSASTMSPTSSPMTSSASSGGNSPSMSQVQTPSIPSSNFSPTSTPAINTTVSTTGIKETTVPFRSMQDFVTLQTYLVGAYSSTRLCRCLLDNRLYALKVFNCYNVYKKKQTEHLRNECELSKRIDCPFIARALKTFHDQENVYLVMEFVPGGDLFGYLRSIGRFSSHQTKFYISEVILALEYLQERNIAHRDLKPENIVLDITGHVKLWELSFTKIIMDRTWTVCGTPDYIAPEVVKGEGYSKVVDFWSLGVLMYELLAGFPPFMNQNPMALYSKNFSITYPEYFDPLAKDLISRLLVVKPEQRLGANGIQEVKQHPYFSTHPCFNWDLMKQKKEPAPLIPKIPPNNPLANYTITDDVDFASFATGFIPDPIRSFFDSF